MSADGNQIQSLGIEYTESDDAVWDDVATVLNPLHEEFACQRYLKSKDDIFGWSKGGVVPQWVVSDRVQSLTEFQIREVAGVVTAREFFNDLAASIFPAASFVRGPQEKFFSPRPDWIHEALGHAATLGLSEAAELYRLFGRAVVHAEKPEQIRHLHRLFWFSAEIGLVREGDELKAFGAAILTSVSEIESFRRGEVRPFDPKVVQATAYDYKRPQPLYFVAESVDHLIGILTEHLEGGEW